MFEELEIHNQFRESTERFASHDPHLRRLSRCAYVFFSPLLTESAFRVPGVFVITGGRQVGKTTCLKQMILRLLTEEETKPADILFITGEMVQDHHALHRIVTSFADERANHQYLFIDEVHYIADWDKGVKFLADSGLFERMTVILTGSDSQIIKTSIKRLAGRRGRSDVTDFTFSPLSFRDYACLASPELRTVCEANDDTSLREPLGVFESAHETLTKRFQDYLIHGGYLPAINEYHTDRRISRATCNTYIHWIVGDVLKHNKTERYLTEILQGIKTTYGSQISWNRLSKHLSIDHHRTVSDYCQILSDMHVLHIQEAIIEHKLTGAPKKDRKLTFQDPFIDHAVSLYLDPGLDLTALPEQLSHNSVAASYVEAICVDHCKRHMPTYYIKGPKGEVDLALVRGGTMQPFEVKWTRQIRPADLKQVSRYTHGIVLSQAPTISQLGTLTVSPALRFLLQMSTNRLLL